MNTNLSSAGRWAASEAIQVLWNGTLAGIIRLEQCNSLTSGIAVIENCRGDRFQSKRLQENKTWRSMPHLSKKQDLFPFTEDTDRPHSRFEEPGNTHGCTV